jgi:hypothetical protein
MFGSRADHRSWYYTTFPTAENPISEGSAWAHLDVNQSAVRVETISGQNVCHGTMAGGAYDDSTAYLSGFTSLNQTIEGVVWKSPSMTSTPNMEVELLLRWSDNNATQSTAYGDTTSQGYEINVNQNGDYINIGYFKSDLLATATLSALIGRAPATGDRFKATIQQRASGSGADIVIGVLEQPRGADL